MHATDHELKELSAAVNATLDSFGQEGVHITRPSLGVLRIVLDVAEWLFVADDDERETDPLPAMTELVSALAQQRVEVSAPPSNGHAPLIPRRPRTLAEVDSDEDGDEVELASTRKDIRAAMATNRLDPEEKAAIYRECINELREMAVGGVMPSAAEWDANRPAHLPKAQALTHRHDTTWTEVAKAARLEIQKPGPKGKVALS